MKNVILFIIFGLFHSIAYAQTKTYRFDAELHFDKLKTGPFHSISHGIKINKSGSDWEVRAQVYSKNKYTWSYGIACGVKVQDNQVYIYGTKVSSSTGNSVKSNSIDSDFVRWSSGFLCWGNNENQKTNTIKGVKDNAYLSLYKQYEGNTSWKERTEVQVIITLSGNVNLSDIEEIRLPGIEPMGFSNPGLSSDHVCSSTSNTEAHCKAIRALDNAQTLSNDVFVVCHRGTWGDQAETSLGSTRKGYENGWTIIEVDAIKSKDGYLVLTHDQQINRTSEYGYSNGNAVLDDKDHSKGKTWFADMNYNSTTSGIKLSKGGSKTYPAIKDIAMTNKWGEKMDSKDWGYGTSDKWTNFRDMETLLDWMANGDKPILLMVDIKDRTKANYLYTVEKTLRLAKQKGVVDHIMIKPGSSLGPDIELWQPSVYKDYLKGKKQDGEDLWDIFSKKITLAQILYPTKFDGSETKTYPFYEFVTSWMQIPSMLFFSTSYRNAFFEEDYGARSFFADVDPDTGVTPEQFILDMGHRTSNAWDEAADCRGAGSGRATWGIPDGLQGEYWKDQRGNLEWVIDRNTGLIVTDRPDVVRAYLELFGQYNSLSNSND